MTEISQEFFHPGTKYMYSFEHIELIYIPKFPMFKLEHNIQKSQIAVGNWVPPAMVIICDTLFFMNCSVTTAPQNNKQSAPDKTSVGTSHFMIFLSPVPEMIWEAGDNDIP